MIRLAWQLLVSRRCRQDFHKMMAAAVNHASRYRGDGWLDITWFNAMYLNERT